MLGAGADDRAVAILERRLADLDADIARLREQQRIIARLLHGRARLRPTRTLDKARWVALLRASGLDRPR